MAWAVMEVLVVQLTTTVFLYGYFVRRLGWMENAGFLAAVLLGYTAIMRPEPLWTWIALGVTAAMMVLVALRPKALQPMAEEAAGP
jgi:hypothetical protein